MEDIKMMSNKIYFDTMKNAGGSFSINNQVAIKGYMCAFKNLIEVPVKDFSIKLIEKLIIENYKVLKKKNVFF